MLVHVCFWLSITILGASALGAAVLSARRKYGGVLNPTNVLVAGVLAASFVLYLPPYLAQEAGDPFQIIKTIMFSARSAVEMLGGGDYGTISGGIGDGDIRPAYLLLTALMTLLAPVVTIGVVMSFFGNIWSSIRYVLAYLRDVCVFSELNQRSLTLAEDLYKQNGKLLLVFTGVKTSDEATASLRDRAKRMGAILFPKDILSAGLHRHEPSKKLWFFAIGEDESTNIDQALGLVARYGNRENCRLNVFSTGIEGEALLTSSQQRAMKVRRVDEVQSLIHHTLYDAGQVLFERATAAQDGTRTISAVVVGMGKHGTAMVKALSWFCQMDGYRLRINAFDPDSKAEDRFAALCPELMDPRYNGVYVDGEAHYDIRIHSGVAVDTKTFTDKIHGIFDATYVLVALGDDSLNIQTALRLRMLFEQCGAKPVIQAIVTSRSKGKALEGLKNYRGQAYNIDFIGDLESCYTERVIIDSEIEADALRRHLRWGEEAEFWSYEYNYRSSMALAIHARAKLVCGIPGAQKAESELTEQERFQLENLEHRRWNAYMRSEGYIYSGSTDKSSRNDLGKMHHDLVEFGSLSEEEKRKDSKAGSA